jgi:hypothetical protein
LRLNGRADGFVVLGPEVAMLKALVPIDGLQVSLCTIRRAIESIEHDEPLSPLGRRRFPAVTAVDGIFQHA